MKSERYKDFPGLDNAVYPALFFIASWGGQVKRAHLAKMLQTMFNVSDENIKKNTTPSGVPQWDLWLNDLRLMMLKQGIIAEPDPPGTWKLTIKGVLKFQQIINERLLQLAEDENNAK